MAPHEPVLQVVRKYGKPCEEQRRNGGQRRIGRERLVQSRRYVRDLIQRGTVYPLGRVYEAGMPMFGTRHFSLRIPQVWAERGYDYPKDIPIEDLVFVRTDEIRSQARENAPSMRAQTASRPRISTSNTRRPLAARAGSAVGASRGDVPCVAISGGPAFR